MLAKAMLAKWLVALSNFDQRFSGEKSLAFSLDENSPYFAPAATRDRTRELPLSVEFRVVPTLLPVRPQAVFDGRTRSINSAA